jgi:hypothetical protein
MSREKSLPNTTNNENSLASGAACTVTLSVIDANNNYRDIGTATTDTSGTFAFTWTPALPVTTLLSQHSRALTRTMVHALKHTSTHPHRHKQPQQQPPHSLTTPPHTSPTLQLP